VNPASEFCTFERMSSSGTCEITLSDVMGKIIFRSSLKDDQQQLVFETKDLLRKISVESSTIGKMLFGLQHL